MRTEAHIALAKTLSEQSVELATWVCLATRVEPALLRRARLSFMPSAPASVEADLWFGPLVETRGAQAIVFYPEDCAELRRQLVRGTDLGRPYHPDPEVRRRTEKLLDAWALVREIHGHKDNLREDEPAHLVQFEEELTWLALTRSGNELAREIDERLQRVIKAIISERREGLGRWALGVLPRLPPEARTRTARLLQMLSEARLYDGLLSTDPTADEQLSEEERSLLIEGLGRVTVGVRLTGDALELSSPPSEGAQKIEVPATNPLSLEVSWGAEPHKKTVKWETDQSAVESGVTAPLSLVTQAGDSYRVVHEEAVLAPVKDGLKSSAVCILNDDGRPVGTGLLVAPRTVLATEERVRAAEAATTTVRIHTTALSFPLLGVNNFTTAREDESPRDDSGRDERIVALSLNTPPPEVARPALLRSAADATGADCVAFGFTPHRPEGDWLRVEILGERADGTHELRLATEVKGEALNLWAGAPVVEVKTGNIVGTLHVHHTPENPDAPKPLLVPASILNLYIPVTLTTSRLVVFVSSTWTDLQAERQAVRQVLERMRATQFAGLEYVSSREQMTPQAALDEVDRSHAYVCIVGERYGSGVTEAEYHRARERRLPCFIYFKDSTVSPSELSETQPDQLARLAAFKDELRSNNIIGPSFISPTDLAAKFTADLHRWLFDEYLVPLLEGALRGEVPRDSAQAVLDQLEAPGVLNRNLFTRLSRRGFNVPQSEDTRREDRRPETTEPLELFFAYSHKDEDLRDELETHLAMLRRGGIISEWHDRRIYAGDEWDGEIDGHINSADLILLLVSPDFIASSYCYDIEVMQALRRHEAREALVLPVILRSCDWSHAPFGQLQALPKGAEPVTRWPDRDEAFLSIAEGIRKAAEPLLTRRRAPPELHSEGVRAAPPHAIPRPPALGFVARRDALGRDIVERLKQELAPGRNQLVTLSGLGGIGKTTLAAEAARALLGAYRGRIVWSSTQARAGFTLLTLLDDIATQLGRADLRTLAPDSKRNMVRELVADPPALVVIDNFETIAPDERRAVEEWFAEAQCSSLFTSRMSIAETIPVPVSAMSREEAEEFLGMLIKPLPDAQIFSSELRQHIYELAEANPFLMKWVVAQIGAGEEPATVFRELSEGEGDAAQRVFDRSFNLPQLGEDGRTALLALSLFTPSASREALAEVAGFGNDRRRLNEAIKNLHALWLIKATDQNRRLTVEGLTRSVVLTRLSGDVRAEELRWRYVAYFRRYAEAHSRRTLEDLNLLEAEKDNVLVAADAAFELQDWESVLGICSAVAAFFFVRGYWNEAVKSGEQARSAARAAGDERNDARFAANLATISRQRGELNEAEETYGEALRIFQRLGDEKNVAVCLHQLGALATDKGDLEGARRLYGESLEINRKLGEEHGVAAILHDFGVVAQQQGDLHEARRLYSESLEINRRLADHVGIADNLRGLGNLAAYEDKIEEARQLYVESLELSRSLGSQQGVAVILHQLGTLAEREGDKTEAVRLLHESLQTFERLGSHQAEAVRKSLAELEGA